jgi:hypothetical protein
MAINDFMEVHNFFVCFLLYILRTFSDQRENRREQVSFCSK